MNIYFLFICILCFLIISKTYSFIINHYLTKNNQISYHYLSKLIRQVSKDNYFMNYGLWNEGDDLMKANQNLIQFIFDKTDLLNKKNKKILDIGCGYGVQDYEWSKLLDKSCTLIAIDISEEQIKHAIKHNQTKTIFEVGDALQIDKMNQKYNVIISLESAFHYSDRPLFFKKVKQCLKGRFVISDIMLSNSVDSSYATTLFIKLFSDFLHIPKQNLITEEEWTRQLSKEFTIIESHDITDKTFNPYYTHFMNTYFGYFSPFFINIFCNIQPFMYKVVICN